MSELCEIIIDFESNNKSKKSIQWKMITNDPQEGEAIENFVSILAMKIIDELLSNKEKRKLIDEVLELGLPIIPYTQENLDNLEYDSLYNYIINNISWRVFLKDQIMPMYFSDEDS